MNGYVTLWVRVSTEFALAKLEWKHNRYVTDMSQIFHRPQFQSQPTPNLKTNVTGIASKLDCCCRSYPPPPIHDHFSQSSHLTPHISHFKKTLPEHHPNIGLAMSKMSVLRKLVGMEARLWRACPRPSLRLFLPSFFFFPFVVANKKVCAPVARALGLGFRV